jgi:5'-3' exonuclease
MQTLKAKYLLIDISNIFRRNYEIRNKLLINAEKDKLYRETIKTTLVSIQKLEKDFLVDNGVLYFLFDNPKSKIKLRSEISEEYKANRKKMPDEYYKAIDNLALILQYRNDNNFLVRCPYLEADDNVKPILEHIRKTDNINNVILCSGDLDYSRSITKNTFWYNFTDMISYEGFKEKYRFYPTVASVTLYKTIKGDTSDCIPIGVKGIRTDDILILISKYNNIYSLLSGLPLEESISDKWKSEFKLNEKRLRINYQLVSYIDISYEEIKEYIIETKYTPSMLLPLYKTISVNHKEFDNRLIYVETKNKNNNDFFDDVTLNRY